MIVTIAASEYGEDGSISTKKGLEDHAATACAIQNFMISLADEGVGSKWMTGALGVAPEAVMGVVGADTEAERFMGAIWYGYPAKDLAEAKAPKRKLGMEMHEARVSSVPFTMLAQSCYATTRPEGVVLTPRLTSSRVVGCHYAHSRAMRSLFI